MSGEFHTKQNRIRELLASRNLDALLLRRASSFSWATCGAASWVNLASTEGNAALLITPSGRYLIADNIETSRLVGEERLDSQGWQICTHPWYEAGDFIYRLSKGLKLGADGLYPGSVDLSADLARLRSCLTTEEGERFRRLGRLCAEAMDEAARAVLPGQAEQEIAGRLGQAAETRGVQPIVNLVAADERIFQYRHPLPTHKKVDSYVMLVLCGRMGGLVCSLTRFIHFGPLPDELRRKAEAAARVDATAITSTRPGKTLGEIFAQIVTAYGEAGAADEWRLHHQGGLAGYEPREILAVPGLDVRVTGGQCYAWNPSITGVKSEDTILVGRDNNEILTTVEGWPVLAVTLDGQVIHRPAILEVE